MTDVSRASPGTHGRRLGWLIVAGVIVVASIAGFRAWQVQGSTEKSKGKAAAPVQVVSTLVTQQDVPVRLTANGTVSAVQTVEVRAQISATLMAVHIKEGQFVRKGEPLFTLDARTEQANLSKGEAQVAKSRAELANAERNLARQHELFRQKFVSQAALDTAQNLVDGLRGQLAVDQAAVQASRVALGFSEIVAPIAGRTGAITVHPGSLVQPGGAALVSITQVDPIQVSFTLPERELPALQQALAQGEVSVSAEQQIAGQPALTGRLVFVDNAVDSASGTIRLKAEFSNADKRLWPGMFVTVSLSPRTLSGVLSVPVQAVQTGPDKKFLYLIGEDQKVTSQPVSVLLVQDGMAVIEGAAPGARVVVEGAQNLRPGSAVAEGGKRAGKQNKAQAGGTDHP